MSNEVHTKSGAVNIEDARLEGANNILGVDYSFQHPSPQAIKAAGYAFVIRYCDEESGKDITAQEVEGLHSMGLGVLLVFERGAQDCLNGATTGAQHGDMFAQQAAALGYPVGMPMWFTADFDIQPNQYSAAQDYLRAAQEHASAWVCSMYCHGGLMNYMHSNGVSKWYWQSESTGFIDNATVNPLAAVYQRQRPTLPLAGGGFDENVLLMPIPIWDLTPAPPHPAPPPPPPPPPQPHRGNPFVPLAVDGSFGVHTCQAMQWVIQVPQDGIFGPQSKRALQAHLHVAQDGIIGPQTVRALQAHVGVAQDGAWGPVTTRGIQTHLNNNTF